MVPSTRAAGSVTPLGSPTKRLRDTPTTTGNPRAANRSSSASTRIGTGPVATSATGCSASGTLEHILAAARKAEPNLTRLVETVVARM